MRNPRYCLCYLWVTPRRQPQYQVILCVVPVVPYSYILEQMVVRPKDVLQVQCQDCGIDVNIIVIVVVVIVERKEGPPEGPGKG